MALIEKTSLTITNPTIIKGSVCSLVVANNRAPGSYVSNFDLSKYAGQYLHGVRFMNRVKPSSVFGFHPDYEVCGVLKTALGSENQYLLGSLKYANIIKFERPIQIADIESGSMVIDFWATGSFDSETKNLSLIGQAEYYIGGSSGMVWAT